MKKGLLISRLEKRLRRLGIDSLYKYYQKVKTDTEELVYMLNCISTNTTNFFRENHHFEYLENKVIPELLKTKKAEKVIRIWSAGCSTGEEPYSIAITMHEAFRKDLQKDSTFQQDCFKGWDIRILATDISTKVLETAEIGIYDHEELPGDMPIDKIKRYFLKGMGKNEGKIKVKDFLKDTIRFRRLNLKDETYPFKRVFDVIFCRNVMIYFDKDMRQHVLSKFHYYLSDTGYLFLGHSESMFSKEQFVPVYITVYRKAESSR
jgi:chemotaxis protein methyltransferase CheR